MSFSQDNCSSISNGRRPVRGLACRRSDRPQYIKDVQRELLAILATARTLAERAVWIEEARVATHTVVAAAQLRALGVTVHPGEQVRSLITNARAKTPAARVGVAEGEGVWRVDVPASLALLADVAAEVLGEANGPPRPPATAWPTPLAFETLDA